MNIIQPASSFIQFICATLRINEWTWGRRWENETTTKNKTKKLLYDMKIHLRPNDWVIMCGTFILSTENKSFLMWCSFWTIASTANERRPNFQQLCFYMRNTSYYTNGFVQMTHVCLSSFKFLYFLSFLCGPYLLDCNELTLCGESTASNVDPFKVFIQHFPEWIRNVWRQKKKFFPLITLQVDFYLT